MNWWALLWLIGLVVFLFFVWALLKMAGRDDGHGGQR